MHEEIADLLEQLRRLQDLQVTIEVRFITLNDNFFERIGVSFDFDINTNIPGKGLAVHGLAGRTGHQYRVRTDSNNSNRTAVVGMQHAHHLQLRPRYPLHAEQLTAWPMPQFGGFDPRPGPRSALPSSATSRPTSSSNAAQGDTRSNVLQAPKVTLFNGQQAYVSDTSQSPFVISVIPVVGDFAAAQQPVIVVLSEGTFMTVQAVVSNDRRFVRLTVVPFFSKIGDVNTFQFTGSTTTTTTDTTRSGYSTERHRSDQALEPDGR